jgi:hypothetical protein
MLKAWDLNFGHKLFLLPKLMFRILLLCCLKTPDTLFP